MWAARSGAILRNMGFLRPIAAVAAFVPTLAVVLLSSPRAEAVGSVSTVAPRPLGMGGAFMAVEDEVAGLSWNPAGLAPPVCRRGSNVRLHLNVLGAPAIARETGLLTGVDSDEFRRLCGLERLAVAVGCLFKSITLARPGFACGILFLEERLSGEGLDQAKGLADASDLLDAYYTSAAVAFRLDPRVSIGASQTVFAGFDASGERCFAMGRSYGAVLHPNSRVAVGLVYFDAPPGVADYRRELEGLAPRTMNAGIAVRATQSLLVTFDLRDLAEKHADTALSPRMGFEWDLWGRGAVRGGAYREDSAGEYVLTLGVGAIPMVGCWSADGRGRGGAFVLNYAAMLSEGSGPRHLLSANLHF